MLGIDRSIVNHMANQSDRIERWEKLCEKWSDGFQDGLVGNYLWIISGTNDEPDSNYIDALKEKEKKEWGDE